MKIGEAKEVLVCNLIAECACSDGSEEYKEALNIAISAIEKQIPAKFKNENLDEYYSGICPNCGKEITKLYKPLYCEDCGQALEWSN